MRSKGKSLLQCGSSALPASVAVLGGAMEGYGPQNAEVSPPIAPPKRRCSILEKDML